MKNSIEFEGMPSGDYESFCWDVDIETFIRITGSTPLEYDESKFNENTYKLYPDDIFIKNKEGFMDDYLKIIKIKIEWEEKNNGFITS